jgi:hypothetical protein
MAGKFKNDLIERKAPVWQWTEKEYMQGNALISSVDLIAVEMERKWGIGRLRLLIPTELRAKFDSQRYKFNTALNSGTLAGLQQECERMQRAYRAADKAATDSGAKSLPEQWEVKLKDGTLAIIVRGDNEEALAAGRAEDIAAGREASVWTLEEVAMLIEQFGAKLNPLMQMKRFFKGALTEVEVVREDPVKHIDRPFDDSPEDVRKAMSL